MPGLTDVLPGVQGTNSQVPAIQKSPLVEGVFSALAGGMQVFQDRKDNAWKDEVRARQRREWAQTDQERSREDTQRAALNEAETSALAIRQQVERDFAPKDNDIATNMALMIGDQSTVSDNQVPRDVRKAATDLATLQAAQDQGRTPTSAIEVKMEALVTSLFQKYPDQTALIGQYFSQRGFDHYLFRGQQQDLTMAEAADLAVKEAFKSSVDYATDRGVGPLPGEDPAAAAERGRILQQNDARQKAAKEAWDLQRQVAQEGRDSAKWDQSQADRTSVQSVILDADTKLGVLMNQMSSLVLAATNDPEAQIDINKLSPGINAMLQTYRVNGEAAIVAMGGGPDAITAFRTTMDQREAGFKSIFSGTTSQIETNKRTLEMMRTTFGLQAGEDLRLYMQFTDIFGKDTLNSMFATGSIAQVFPPEVLQGIKDEISGWRTDRAELAGVHLNNAIQLMKGQKGIHEFTEEGARAQMPGLAATVSSVQAAILKGDKSPETMGRWAVAYSNLVNASVEIQDGSTDYKAINRASNLLASPGARKVIDMMIGQPETREQGLALAQASRIASARLLMASQKTPPAASVWQKLEYRNGQYEVVFNADAYRAALRKPYDPRSDTYGGVRVPPEDVARIKDPRLVAQSQNLNWNLTNLVELARYRDDLPPGVTKGQLRESYRTGRPLTKPDGTVMKTGDQLFQENLDGVRQEIAGFTFQTIESPQTRLLGGRTEFLSQGPNWEPNDIRWVTSTVFGEANGEPTAGQRAVAAVIMNRARKTGKSFKDIVLESGQFEPWGSAAGRARMFDMTEEQGQKILKALGTMSTGQVPADLSTYDSFYAPDLQAQLGRRKPAWDDGKGVSIGGHLFFGGNYN